MDWITNPDLWLGFIALTVMEIVLGIDNIVFISILSSKLPESQQSRARLVGLGAAMIMRILLLFAIGVLIGLISVHQGYTARPTGEGVAYATTRTVIHSAIAILAFDFVLTAFLM